MITNQLICSLSLTSLIRRDDPLSDSHPIVDPVSDLSIHLQGLLTINSQNLIRRVLPILTIWFPFVDDLGHTLSVTTQNTRYVDRRYWPRLSKSK